MTATKWLTDEEKKRIAEVVALGLTQARAARMAGGTRRRRWYPATVRYMLTRTR
jgi:hypothetical protein